MRLEPNTIIIIFGLIAANILQFLIGWLRSSLLASERDGYEQQAKRLEQELNAAEQVKRILQFRLDCALAASSNKDPDPHFYQAILSRCIQENSYLWVYHLVQNRVEPLGPNKEQLPRIAFNEPAIRKLNLLREGSIKLSIHDFALRSRDGVHVDQLYVIPCGGRKMLLLSEIPTITGNSLQDFKCIVEACSRFETQKRNSIQPVLNQNEDASSQVELELAREMLELRTLTDHQFTTPKEMLETFLARLAILTGFERTSLYLLNDTSGVRELFAWGGHALSEKATQDWLSAEEIICHKHHVGLQEALPITAELIAQHNLPFQSGLITPAFHGSEEIGFLLLTSRREYTPDAVDLQLVHWAAEFIVQTLVKTLNRALIEDQVRRDALTQVANRHAFEMEFPQIVQQALFLERNCSLILMDIDHFKKINDMHGHPAGDAALQQVAGRIQGIVSHLRVTDRPLLARYGGEEFALLLPNIGETGAMRIAETIRIAVAEATVEFHETKIPVTLSAGVATLPAHGMTADELLSRADAALYHAKNSGRNRVELASHQVQELAT